jgi:transcriptional regulator with XRE-family HTH domain
MVSRQPLFAMQDRFSSGLREALRAKYGRLPSAAFVAIQFNRQLNSRNGVSQESVRRWLRGLAMPSYCHLETLTLWLKLDLGQLLGSFASAEQITYPEHVMRTAEIIARMPPATQVPLLSLVSSFGVSGSKSSGGSHK